MRRQVPTLVVLTLLAAPAAAMDFQPGYWDLTLTAADGHTSETYKRCLHDVKPKFTAAQRKYCERLTLSVKGNVMTSRVHCKYPTAEFTSLERLTFAGNTLKGTVQMDVTKPRRARARYTMSGKLLGPTCPQAPAAASR